MNATDYEKQGTEFCRQFDVKFTAFLYPLELQKAPKWTEDGQCGLRYRITLERHGKIIGFDFWDSIADRDAGRQPTAYDVLACVSGDINCPDDFDEFCDEYGYDNDSRRAHSTWKATRKLAKKLRTIFDDEDSRDALALIQ